MRDDDYSIICCKSCAEMNKSSYNFCGYCGKSLVTVRGKSN